MFKLQLRMTTRIEPVECVNISVDPTASRDNADHDQRCSRSKGYSGFLAESIDDRDRQNVRKNPRSKIIASFTTP